LSNTKNKLYRPEIDGLRAFAVLAVIINHFNSGFLQSGYLGVDIFFVISGFVITSSLSEKKSENFFQFILGFYERRVKRILPSLIFYVLMMSVIICFFKYDPQTELRTGISSLFGLSNIYLFIRSTDYFSASANLNPFTNTWSLGVEEQFYLIFPLFIWFSGYLKNKNKGAKNLFFVLIILFFISGFFFISQYSTNQPSAYFLMHNRFWEIALGSLVFLGIKRKFAIPNLLNQTLPFLILFLMVLTMYQPLSRGLISTFFIVLLTAILIILLKQDSALRRILSKKEIVNTGKLSYSLYLWHWGVISISYLTVGIHWWSLPFQLIVVYILSLFSFNYIENPLRKKSWALKKIQIIINALFILLFSAISIFVLDSRFKKLIYLGDENLNLKKPYFKHFSLDEKYCFIYDENKDYRIKNIFSKCMGRYKNASRTLFFLGDSYTHAFWRAAEHLSIETNSAIFTLSAPETHFPINKYQDQKQKIFSKREEIFDSLEKYINLKLKAGDVVFLNNFLGEYEDSIYKREFFEGWLQSLEDFVESNAKNNISIIVFTPTPNFEEVIGKRCRTHNPQWFNKFSSQDCTISKSIDYYSSKNGKYENIINKLNDLSLKYENLYVFDSLKAMCPDSDCQYNYLGKSLYADQHHLSNYSVRHILAPRIIDFLKEEKIILF